MALSGGPDFHQELAVLRELHDHAVVIQRRPGTTPCAGRFVGWSCASARCCAATATCARKILVSLGPAVAADPNVAFVVDGDAMVGSRPNIAISILTAPARQQIAGFIELQHRRRWHAAF